MLRKIISAVLTVTVLAFTLNGVLVANASALTALSDTMSNQTISANSTHYIAFTTPTGVTASSQTIVITFPSGFNFTSYSITNLTLKYGTSCTVSTNTCSGGATATIAASPGASTTWGAVFSGTNNVTLTLTSPTSGTYIAAGNQVIVGYTSSTNSVNPSSAANYAVSITANTDTGSVTVPIITNSQVAISATVAQTLSFAISANSLNFGTLSSSAAQYANTSSGSSSEVSAHNITASTNGTSGYTVALSGNTLQSGANSIAGINGGSAVALSAGSNQFGIRATASGGSGTVSAPFNGASGNYGFGSTTSISNSTFASATAPTATTTYSVYYAANIAPTTAAGSYSTTLTYVATANF